MVKTTKRLYKHKLLLDENFPVRKHFPNLNRRFNVKHIGADLNQEGLSDPEVYALARKEKRIIVTRNIKDFEKLALTSKDTGVIGIPSNLIFEQIDKKLTALLKRSTRKSLLGKITKISAELERSQT